MNRQTSNGLTISHTPVSFVVFCSLDREQSSRGSLLEDLESSDAKHMMRRPIVCKLCMERNRETRSLRTKKFTLHFFFFALPVYYCIEGF